MHRFYHKLIILFRTSQAFDYFHFDFECPYCLRRVLTRVLCNCRVTFSWGITIRGHAETSWDTPELQLCGTEHRWGHFGSVGTQCSFQGLGGAMIDKNSHAVVDGLVSLHVWVWFLGKLCHHTARILKILDSIPAALSDCHTASHSYNTQ